ncbi:uncharacterized protein LOC127087262 isoform X2 [Lathyrus oleraceus]|nr:uncharacterized protein LOC127087262 isoform X2 [Pisum sativum]
MDLRQVFDNRRKSLPFVEENGYSASFQSDANNWLGFWLYLVASSYFLLRENVNFFSGSRIKSQENVSSCNKSTLNERTENDATVVDDAVSYSESLGSPRSTCSSTYFDTYSEISDFDRTSYWHSLLSLEDEDSEWLSDSMISENLSSPLSYSGDSFTEFSDVDTPSYWDSLLKLEEEDREWNMDKASYWHSFPLLSLEDEDSEWLSDSITSESPSSPLSFSGDSFTDISDVGTPTYWDSLLRLDKEENSEWVSDFNQQLECVQDGSPISSYKINWGNVVLPPVSTISSFNCDEPLFWPFEGEFDWDSEESSFCNSPRKNVVFDSNMDSPLEYFALNQEFAIETLVGLKEFDGHEGLELDYEFIGDGFMLEEFLQ